MSNNQLQLNNEQQEQQLFDSHMETMYDLADELLDREELTEAEEAFLDALIAWEDFVAEEKEEE